MNFGGIIREWYKKNKRDLPWRRTNDPYNIWISEVILQQTRIDQGLDYYNRFVETFPDLRSLALADEQQVLKTWQGLGYYSRARNLHRSARDIMELRGGRFPGTYLELLEMKGVGPYTAAAIASICFCETRAVVDGNVSRVIARLYGVDEPINRPAGSRRTGLLAQQLMDEGPESGSHFHPGLHNQAMMEFGALQCIPVSPRCTACPLSSGCHANLNGKVERLPVKIPGKKPVDRWIDFYVVTSGGKTILEKRSGTDIWGSLYQFPTVEGRVPRTEQQAVEEMPAYFRDREISLRHCSDPVRHQLTHRTIHARFIHLEVSSLHTGLPEGWIAVPTRQIDQFPVSRLIHRYLESVKF